MRISPRTRPARLVLLLFLVASLAAAGCGKPKSTVTGKVLYKNAPLKGGTVTFVNDDGTTKVSKIGEDGTYTINDIQPGEVKILVETASLKPQTMGDARKFHYDAPKGPEGQESEYKPKDPNENLKRYIPIPPMYGDLEKSDLKYMVQRGQQTFDIVVPEVSR